jgi:hypothetical protein
VQLARDKLSLDEAIGQCVPVAIGDFLGGGVWQLEQGRSEEQLLMNGITSCKPMLLIA